MASLPLFEQFLCGIWVLAGRQSGHFNIFPEFSSLIANYRNYAWTWGTRGSRFWPRKVFKGVLYDVFGLFPKCYWSTLFPNENFGALSNSLNFGPFRREIELTKLLHFRRKPNTWYWTPPNIFLYQNLDTNVFWFTTKMLKSTLWCQ